MTANPGPAPDSMILEGDCREVLKRIAENTVDGVVTDPPYGLSAEPDVAEVMKNWLEGSPYEHSDKGGFMGKAWDSFVPGPEYWREVYRVLKPGGYALVFAGTRTQDLMTIALRFAGFEIRDVADWLYGCLDEESEILTAAGWKRGLDAVKGETVAAWDPETAEIRLVPVLETIRAPFSGEMVRFKNDNTDQRVTPNHRVMKKHALRAQKNGDRRRFFETAWTATEAAEINRHQPIKLPLAGYHDGPGVGGTDRAALLGWIFTEGGFDAEGTGVRLTQSSVNPEHVLEIDRLVRLFAPGFKKYERTRTYEPTNGNPPRDYVEHTWFFSGEPALTVRAELPGKHPTFDLLWRMTLDEKRAFLGAAMRGDGSGTAFYQKNVADREWFATLAHVLGWQGRDNPRADCVSLHANATTELQSRQLKAANREQYDGEVWCVRVETGAFLARRNGRIFVTGNSGFPKSLDVSKSIDKKRDDKNECRTICRFVRAAMDLQGIKSRDLVAEGAAFEGANARLVDHWAARDTDSQPECPPPQHWRALIAALDLDALPGFDAVDAECLRLNARKGLPGEAWNARAVTGMHEHAAAGQIWQDTYGKPGDLTPKERRDEATTAAAKRWEGYGTALKPAREPIIICRKPLEGTVAENVQKWGVGAINVNGCRIGFASADDQASATPQGKVIRNNFAPGEGVVGTETNRPDNTGGRWPANVIFDEEAAAALDEQTADKIHGAGKARDGSTAVVADGYDASSYELGPNRNMRRLGDDGGASRFFQVMRSPVCTCVSIAASSSNPREQPAGSVPSDAATSDLLAGKCCEIHYPERSSSSSASVGSVTSESTHTSSDRGGVDSLSGGNRFIYCAKTSRKERDLGCESLPVKSGGEATDRDDDTDGLKSPRAGAGRGGGVRNFHPTVKPVALMRYLCRLIGARAGFVILDPFTGSGTTGMGAVLEGAHFVGIEREPDYAKIARLRIAAAPSIEKDTRP